MAGEARRGLSAPPTRRALCQARPSFPRRAGRRQGTRWTVTQERLYKYCSQRTARFCLLFIFFNSFPSDTGAVRALGAGPPRRRSTQRGSGALSEPASHGARRRGAPAAPAKNLSASEGVLFSNKLHINPLPQHPNQNLQDDFVVMAAWRTINT